MADKLIPIEIVMERIHLKRTKIYDMISKGEFPSPIKIGSASRWRESAVQNWIDAQVKEQDSAIPAQA